MSLFGKLFGGKKKSGGGDVESLVRETVEGLLEKPTLTCTLKLIPKQMTKEHRFFWWSFLALTRKSSGTKRVK